MSETLDEMLNPSGPVVLVKPDGTYAAAARPKRHTDYPPESIEINWSGEWDAPDITKADERDAIASMRDGWEVLTGWGDDESPFYFPPNLQHLGSDLESHILATPGLWSCVSVEMYAPHCEEGEDGVPCEEFEAHDRCDHADSPAESRGVGWALVRRDRVVTLGEPLPKRDGALYDWWQVFRDGVDTGTLVVETYRGYAFQAPGSLTGNGIPHRGRSYPFREGARKDAEEWLTQNIT